ncbi:ATP-grasp domain-containing protein [Saccharothrix syringae]|uniref:ATP-grasp domain-containing protein n=1 Tax=Saccharothrix syringae TaxID=103733 RepID=A0A5Q0GXX1_SACSY|nr:ATP-grasp domain-containing protein [Saccharothrix syringae]QFZ18340.1 ATP-grasp domain-containing protein [Saccharothrix syringae]
MSFPSGARGVALLAALVVTAPVTAAVCGVAHLLAPRRPCGRRSTVLVTTTHMTKSLLLARKFHEAGHRVVAVSIPRHRWGPLRFSRAACAFHLVADPAADPAGYVRDLVAVIRAEGVDTVVPVVDEPGRAQPTSDAVPVLAGHCAVLANDPATHRLLNDKAGFAELVRAAGLPDLETRRITDVRQVREADPRHEYVLKPPEWTSMTADHRVVLVRDPAAPPADLPIGPDRPWVLQRLATGREYCAHTTCRAGRITAYTCSESSALQLNYHHVEVPAIWRWVRDFVAAHRLDGQVSFDFIVGADGVPRAIECNPRPHSALVAFHDSPDLAAAYLDPAFDGVARPRPGSPPVHWLGAELGRPRTWARTLLRGKDAVFDRRDPIPFLVLHHVQLPVLLVRALAARKRWERVNWATGKLV